MLELAFGKWIISILSSEVKCIWFYLERRHPEAFLREHQQGLCTENGRGSGKWPVTTSGPGEKQSTALSVLCSQPLLSTFHPDTRTNGWASGSVLHFEVMIWCLKHYPSVEVIHDELVFALELLKFWPRALNSLWAEREDLKEGGILAIVYWIFPWYHHGDLYNTSQ